MIVMHIMMCFVLLLISITVDERAIKYAYILKYRIRCICKYDRMTNQISLVVEM